MMEPSPPKTGNSIVVYIDRDLEDIVPGFLENRHKDAATLQTALAENDMETVQLLGHRMKGDGAGYGFQKISELGDWLETAALRNDLTAIKKHTAALIEFLSQVEVVFQK